MRETKSKNNVTVNRDYDKNLAKIKSESKVLVLLGSPIGFGLSILIGLLIFTPLTVLGFNYLREMTIEYYELLHDIAWWIILLPLTYFSIKAIISLISDARLYFKTFKYASRLPKEAVDFDKLDIKTLGDYTEYILKNIFTYRSKDNIVTVECPFVHGEDLNKSIRVALVYYAGKGKLEIKGNQVGRGVYDVDALSNNTKKYFKATQEFEELRPLFILSELISKGVLVKTYIDREGKIHAVCSTTENMKEYGSTVDFNISNTDGDFYFGCMSRDNIFNVPMEDTSVFNSLCSEIDSTLKTSKLWHYIDYAILIVITLMLWLDKAIGLF